MLSSAAASSSPESLIVPVAIVLVFTGILLATLSVLRRRVKGGDFASARGFSLTELRDLHRQGKLTDEEFERAKSLLVGKVHSKLASEAKPTIAAKPLGSELKSDPLE